MSVCYYYKSLNPVECFGCTEGINFCATPCWGSPDDVQRLIQLGFGNKLMLHFWYEEEGIIEILSPARLNYEGKLAPIPSEINYCNSVCVMLNKETHSCNIHKHKPIVGKIACCGNNSIEKPNMTLVHLEISSLWKSDYAKKIVNEWKNQYYNGEFPSCDEVKDLMVQKVFSALIDIVFTDNKH